METEFERLMTILKNIEGSTGRKELEVTLFLNLFRGKDGKKIIYNEAVHEILADLAYDLEFYVADENKRKESTSFYGDERLKNEISEALKKINKAIV